MKLTIICAAITLLASVSIGQTTFKGVITDKETKDALPYANLILKRQQLGTTTNSMGEYQFKIDDLNDTLVIHYLGYESYKIALSELKPEAKLKMIPSGIELSEVVVRPKPPTYYIKQAVLRKEENYATSDFNTLGYYRQAVTENGNPLHFKESFIKTYYNMSPDSNEKNQHQILLYSEPEVISEMQFMKEKIEKSEKKAKKKAEKKGEEYEEESTKEMIASSFSGPETVIRKDWMDDEDSYLDSNLFKKYNYHFGKPTTYGGKKVMVIHFETKRKVDHTRQKGTLYLEENSMALVKLDLEGEFVIPVIAKPILFALGLGIENPTFVHHANYTERNEKWYPQFVDMRIHMNMIEKHLFKKNEESKFYLELLYNVNELELDNVQRIPEDKRYNSKEPMKEQVHQDPQITWSQVNKIR